MSEVDPNAPIYPAAVRPDPLPMPRQLCDHFVYQKNLALERAGVDLATRTPMSAQKAWTLYGETMEKMSKVLSQWDADPGVVMEACFAYSRSKRHAEGPQLNMLGSAKYLLQAIAYHLEVPKDAAMDMMSKEAMLRHLAKDAANYEATLRQSMRQMWGSDDPAQLEDPTKVIEINMITSVPTLYRFLIYPKRLLVFPKIHPMGLTHIPEILETLRVDAKQRLWAERCEWTYLGLAGYYRVIQPRQEEGPA